MIERLTSRDYYGEASLKGRDFVIRAACNEMSSEDAHALLTALSRLAYYEDSGLMPEEVEELVIGEKTDTVTVGSNVTSEKAIAMLRNEIECVKSGDTYDRDCGKCPLVKESGDIIDALEYAIQAIKLCAARMDAKEGKP